MNFSVMNAIYIKRVQVKIKKKKQKNQIRTNHLNFFFFADA